MGRIPIPPRLAKKAQMTDAQTDREHLQAVIEAAESYVGIGWDHANESDDLTSKIAAAKQHLDTTTPSPNESEIRADERRRIDELAEALAGNSGRVIGMPETGIGGWSIGNGFDIEECFGATFTEALEAATQSIQAEAGGPENG